MKIATTTEDFLCCATDVEKIQQLHKAGFRYIDLSMYSFTPDCVYMQEGWQEEVEKIKKQAKELGMQFVQAHSQGGNPLSEDKNHVDFLVNATLRSIEICQMLGIKNTVVHSGWGQGLTKEEWFAKNKAFFMPLLDAAEKYGVNILVENFNKMHIPDMYWIDNAPDLLAMIEYVNHPLFHAVWDVGHANMQEMPQDEALRMLGGHVRALHIQDNLGDKDTHLVPFLGTLNLDAVMNGLLDIGYNGYFTFEVGKFFLPPEKRTAYARGMYVSERETQILLPR